LANGNVKPVRILAGQATKLSRTMHGIFYDGNHDEMVVPVALAGAVLVFRGAANGAEVPLRTLQGPRTQIVRPDTLYVDVEHNELVVDSGSDSILIFDRDAQGEAAPLRVIRGPKTGISNIYGLTVDPIRNLIFVANRVGEETGRDTSDSILVFNRTDNGDVAPKARIGGPRTGMLKIRQIQSDPERGQLFVTVKNNREHYDPDAIAPSPWHPGRTGFIGVWNATDDGDVPPKAIIKGPATGLVWPAGVAINPDTAEVFTVDSVSNSLFTFSMPELFRRPSSTASRQPR
jgi:DNA-binding beta-propeller fold protein YncE